MNCSSQRIDVVMALDVLVDCVRAFPPEHEIRSGKASLMVDLALSQLGATFDELSVAPIVPDRDEMTETLTEARTTTFTIGAVVAFRSARRAELRGSTWERAICVARCSVMRLLDVVPQAVFDAALAERTVGSQPTLRDEDRSRPVDR